MNTSTRRRMLIAAGSGLVLPARFTMAQNVALRVFSWYGTETETFTAEMTARARRLQLRLEVEPVVWDQMQPLLQARMAAGTLPDVLDFKGQDIATYAPGGALMDLTGQPWLKAIPEAARAGLRVAGKEYGMPYSTAFQGVFFNRAVFAKHGVAVPGTYAALIQAAQALKAKGVTPFAMHLKDDWHIGNMLMQIAMPEVFQSTPDWADRLYAGKASFESTEGYRHAFTALKELATYSWRDAFSADLTEAAKRFLRGQAAMFISGTWLNTNLEIDPRFDYGIFPFPARQAGARLLFEPNHTWAIAAKTRQPAAALKLLEMLASDKQLATILCDEAGAYSLLDGVRGSRVRPCDKDIDAHRARGHLSDVSVGNNQLRWAYQLEVARLAAEFMLNRRSLDDALTAATALRTRVLRRA